METIQIDFDPEKVSYANLLELFFSNHNPTWPSPIRQYASAIFYQGEEQKRKAKEAMDEAAKRYGEKISTELLPYESFTRAEDYHQKYYLRNTPAITDQYKKVFPSEGAFTDSTAVTRVNGYIGGNGSTEQLEKEKTELGINTGSIDALRKILRKAGK